MRDEPVSERSLRRLCALLLTAVLIAFAIVPVSADVGPKPSVTVSVEGRPGETLYATLLSKDEVYGPWFRITEENIDGAGGYGPLDADHEVYEAFFSYRDPDGYMLMNQIFKVEGNGSFSWSYYPPKEFKAAVYVPSENRIFVSGELEREAFDSFFSAVIPDLSGKEAELQVQPLYVTEDIRTGNQILAFFVRMLLTIAVELGLALLFKYRKKREILTIVITNIVTQGLLNLVMGLLDYTSGGLVWLIFFPVMELLVFVIELIVYLIAFKGHSKGKTFGYTLLANLLTAALGLAIALYFMAR